MLLRDSGQYWPSVCHYMGAAATSFHYYHSFKKLFIGLDNGTIVEFKVSDDFNRMDSIRDYHAHQGRVTGVQLTSNDWLLRYESRHVLKLQYTIIIAKVKLTPGISLKKYLNTVVPIC